MRWAELTLDQAIFIAYGCVLIGFFCVGWSLARNRHSDRMYWLIHRLNRKLERVNRFAAEDMAKVNAACEHDKDLVTGLRHQLFAVLDEDVGKPVHRRRWWRR